MLPTTTELTSGARAERSGIATSAIRYYEERGLVRSRRTTGNQRRYERAMLRRLAFIRTAQRVGLSLEEIEQALATLPSSRTPTKADWSRLSRGWRPRLDAPIAPLARLPATPPPPPRLRLPQSQALQPQQPGRPGRRPWSGSGLPRGPLSPGPLAWCHGAA